MKLIAIIILLFISHLTLSQTINLEGKIIDSKTKQPLPFATIEIFSLKTGTIADEKGEFILLLDSTGIDKSDTITFSYLGYKKVRITIKDFLKQKTIELTATPIDLDEIIVLPKKYKIAKLGIFKNKPHGMQVTNVFFNKIGNYFENKKAKAGWLVSASFYVHKNGHPETPFRIRVFGLDKEKKCPGKDILTENVVVAATKPGWFKVDLSNYNIRFPVDGFFVMMEWLNHGDKYTYFYEMPYKRDETGKIIKKKRKFYGQTIGSVIKQPNMITWGVTPKLEWVPYELFKKGYINAMINVEVAYAID